MPHITKIVLVNSSRPYGKHTSEVEEILKKHPSWIVVNCPRPIAGYSCWGGNFRHGVFYAVGDPARYLPGMGGWITSDAWQVKTITNQEVAERICYTMLGHGVDVLEALDWQGGWAALAESEGLPWNEEYSTPINIDLEEGKKIKKTPPSGLTLYKD